jgi:hypothetical protein
MWVIPGKAGIQAARCMTDALLRSRSSASGALPGGTGVPGSGAVLVVGASRVSPVIPSCSPRRIIGGSAYSWRIDKARMCQASAGLAGQFRPMLQCLGTTQEMTLRNESAQVFRY